MKNKKKKKKKKKKPTYPMIKIEFVMISTFV